MIGERKIKYECEDNDNIIKVVVQDGILDEIHVSHCESTEYHIISCDDLHAALAKADAMIEEQEELENMRAKKKVLIKSFNG